MKGAFEQRAVFYLDLPKCGRFWTVRFGVFHIPETGAEYRQVLERINICTIGLKHRYKSVTMYMEA
jgi:hypothetical protein